MRPLAVFVILAMAPVLSAQVTPLAISAGILLQTGAVTAPSVAPGLDVTNGVALGTSGALGTAQFQAAVAAATTAIDLDWSVSCSAYGATTAGSQGTIRYELTAAQSVSGRFVVTWIPTLTGTGAASCSLDLLDDGTVDATGSAVWPVTFGPGVVPLRVRVQTVAYAGVVHGPWGSQWSYQGTANGTLRIRFEPTHCQSVVFGQGCADPQLAVLGNFTGGADLRGSFVPAVDLGVAVLGFDQVATPLPLAPGCSLLTTPIVLLWRPIGPGLTAAWSLALPAAVRPAVFAAQLVGIDVDTFTATTSEGRWITCQ